MQTTKQPPKPVPPAEFQEGAIAQMDGAGLQKILSDANATDFQKAKACQRAGETGAVEAVPALAALLGHPHLGTYARYGLEPIHDASVDEALRAALPKLEGNALVGVINSLGKRRNAKALGALLKLTSSSDLNVSRSAVSAIGSIGTTGAARELRVLLAKAPPPARANIANACLLCAERLVSGGERDLGMKFYAFLSGPEIHKPVRLGAMAAIIREESLSRKSS